MPYQTIRIELLTKEDSPQDLDTSFDDGYSPLVRESFKSETTDEEQQLDSQYIETLADVETPDEEQQLGGQLITVTSKEELVQKRYDQLAIFQRLRLLLAADDYEISAALLWMTERGKELEDLIAVKNFRKDPAFDSNKFKSDTCLNVKSEGEKISQR